MIPSPVASPWGGRGFYVEQTESTMADALALEAAGFPPGSFVTAGEQTAGRGRLAGRRWMGHPGASLAFTFYLLPSHFGARTLAPSLVLGLGVCLWAESLGLSPRIKWPNDVLVPLDGGMGKLCGILVTSRWSAGGAQSYHCGIGVNLERPPEKDLSRPAASLGDFGVKLTPDEALAGLFPFLARAAAEAHPRPWVEDRLWPRGQVHGVDTPGGRIEGKILGLDETGALVMETPQGIQLITAGE